MDNGPLQTDPRQGFADNQINRPPQTAQNYDVDKERVQVSRDLQQYSGPFYPMERKAPQKDRRNGLQEVQYDVGRVPVRTNRRLPLPESRTGQVVQNFQPIYEPQGYPGGYYQRPPMSRTYRDDMWSAPWQMAPTECNCYDCMRNYGGWPMAEIPYQPQYSDGTAQEGQSMMVYAPEQNLSYPYGNGIENRDAVGISDNQSMTVTESYETLCQYTTDAGTQPQPIGGEMPMLNVTTETQPVNNSVEPISNDISELLHLLQCSEKVLNEAVSGFCLMPDGTECVSLKIGERDAQATHADAQGSAGIAQNNEVANPAIPALGTIQDTRNQTTVVNNLLGTDTQNTYANENGNVAANSSGIITKSNNEHDDQKEGNAISCEQDVITDASGSQQIQSDSTLDSFFSNDFLSFLNTDKFQQAVGGDKTVVFPLQLNLVKEVRGIEVSTQTDFPEKSKKEFGTHSGCEVSFSSLSDGSQKSSGSLTELALAALERTWEASSDSDSDSLPKEIRRKKNPVLKLDSRKLYSVDQKHYKMDKIFERKKKTFFVNHKQRNFFPSTEIQKSSQPDTTKDQPLEEEVIALTLVEDIDELKESEPVPQKCQEKGKLKKRVTFDYLPAKEDSPSEIPASPSTAVKPKKRRKNVGSTKKPKKPRSSKSSKVIEEDNEVQKTHRKADDGNILHEPTIVFV